MIRTVEHYREDIKDGRDIRKDGERFKNVATHPAFKPIIDVNSCMFDTAHEPGHADAIIYRNGDKVNFIFYRPPDAELCADFQGWHLQLRLPVGRLQGFGAHRILLG